MLLPWEGGCLEICSDCNAALKGVSVWAEPSSSTLVNVTSETRHEHCVLGQTKQHGKLHDILLMS